MVPVAVPGAWVMTMERTALQPDVLVTQRAAQHLLAVENGKYLGNLRHYRTPAITVAYRLYGAPSDDAHRPAAVEALLQEAVKKLGGGRSGEDIRRFTPTPKILLAVSSRMRVDHCVRGADEAAPRYGKYQLDDR
jgi:hypothetical protein